MFKKVPFCGEEKLIKNGIRGGVQRYHCRACKRSCDGSQRPSAQGLQEQFLHGKQTYGQLASQHRCSTWTIRRKLDALPPVAPRPNALPGRCVVVMDTTYFGRGLGVLVLKDAATGRNLYAAPLTQETTALYHTALARLHEHHCHVEAIVCDGRRGLFGTFGSTPMQMCHFHKKPSPTPPTCSTGILPS